MRTPTHMSHTHSSKKFIENPVMPLTVVMYSGSASAKKVFRLGGYFLYSHLGILASCDNSLTHQIDSCDSILQKG